MLNATPTDDAEKQRLITELKSRAGAAFKAGQLPVAEILYSKAIEHDGASAPLYGNRSMMRVKMSKFEEALADGKKATEIDPTWPKGFFRTGMALKGLERYAEAYKAFEAAAKLEPDNKDVQKELTAAQKAADKQAAEAAKAEKFEIEDLPTSYKPPPSSAPSDKAPVKISKPTTVTEGSGDADMKGYKILADGRKTSFFHHEMTEEEKKLMGYGADGNLAPKAISAEEAAKMEAEIAAKAGANPVWAGNTWVDKKLDKWAQEKVEELLKDCSFAVPEKKGGVLRVTGIKDWVGTASIYIKTGKARYLFDLGFKVTYEGTGLVENLSGLCDKKVEGEIKFTDVLPDDVEDKEVVGQAKFTGDTPSGDAHTLATKYTTKADKGLQAAIVEKLVEFSKQFHAYPLN